MVWTNDGFFVRKSKVVKRVSGDKFQKMYVCSKEEFHKNRGLTRTKKRRKLDVVVKPFFFVHVNFVSKQWNVIAFINDHSHEMLEESYCSLCWSWS